MDDFQRFMADWAKEDAERAKRDAEEEAERIRRGGCAHANLPVKFDAADCAGKDEYYVRKHYPRFYGPCPDCGEKMIGYASFEHYIAGDW